MAAFRFKQATTPREFDQIHRLNHQTFSEEIRQHHQTGDRLLIDRFHAENRYFIALDRHHLAGMIAVHAGPEFSITSRLPDPTLLKNLRAPLEVRLLAVDPRYRGSRVLPGLLVQVFRYAGELGSSDLLISGISHREAMYRKMGFDALGPAVQSGEAAYIPMRLSLDTPPPHLHRLAASYASIQKRRRLISLLPGPVEIAPPVTRAFHAVPVSHRAPGFITLYDEVRSRLSLLMGGMHSTLLQGGGTLANDVVAANLFAAFRASPGLVISNGEFGERLIRQAQRAGLTFRTACTPWGAPWDFTAIEQELDNGPAWVWAVHLETSTGVLNDLSRLLDSACRRSIAVAADCVSSLGGTDTRLCSRLFLASGVSGKALGSYAGLAILFASSDALNRLQGRELCPTFDLLRAIRAEGPVSTVSTPLVQALAKVLRDDFPTGQASSQRFSHHQELGRWTRTGLRACGLTPIADEIHAAPTITTFPLPPRDLIGDCRRAGFQIAHQSDYLLARNWGQIATMGCLKMEVLQPLFEALRVADPGGRQARAVRGSLSSRLSDSGTVSHVLGAYLS